MDPLPLASEIERISFDILRASKCLDIFPTPVDRVVEYSELLVRKDIDIATIHAGYITRKYDVLKRAVGQLRGLLVRNDKEIFLDLSQKPVRQRFVKLHEAGHHVLPWQKKMHDLVEDDDRSLSSDTIDEFEVEANFFASETLFQGNRFTDEMAKFGLGIDTALHLANHFGASNHATLRRLVEHSKKRCALIVLEDFNPGRVKRGCKQRNLFHSEKFEKAFGTLSLPDKFDETFPFVNDFYYKRRLKDDGLITLVTDDGDINFAYEFFNSGWNSFALIYPIGERKEGRSKISVANKY
jgi:Zn-dependent peptidase ImmA (M78 family)